MSVYMQTAGVELVSSNKYVYTGLVTYLKLGFESMTTLQSHRLILMSNDSDHSNVQYDVNSGTAGRDQIRQIAAHTTWHHSSHVPRSA